jgi:chaperonin cofactor prefoldin
MNYLKKYNMTYSEDVKRASSTDTVDYLNARIEALEKRVEFLEAQIEIKNN